MNGLVAVAKTRSCYAVRFEESLETRRDVDLSRLNRLQARRIRSIASQ